MLEKELERKCVKYAKDKGFLVYKFTSPSQRAVPDRIFIAPMGRVIFVEFKAEGKTPTKAQMRECTKLRNHLQIVRWFDSFDRFKVMVDAYAEYTL